MTPDRIFYPLAALVAGALIALAAVYPQGQGARSPGVFGHNPDQQTAAGLTLVRRNAQFDAETRKAAEAMKRQQAHPSAPSPVPANPLK